MKRTVFTLLASLPFIIFRILGESIGQVGADILFWVQTDVMAIDFSPYVAVFSTNILAGVVGGVFAAWGCSSLYKYYSMKIMLIIPSIYTLLFMLLGGMSIWGNDFSVESIAQFISQFAGLYVFYMMLKEKYISKYDSMNGAV